MFTDEDGLNYPSRWAKDRGRKRERCAVDCKRGGGRAKRADGVKTGSLEEGMAETNNNNNRQQEGCSREEAGERVDIIVRGERRKRACK